QAIEFRKPLHTSAFLQNFVDTFRKEVSFIQEDRLLHNDMKKAEDFLKHIDLSK
ncbi:MAG: histidine ammonia-lyase, partial [Cytophagia bacterium]|nr:histidine ammonia-lyase [Cytophagia bacterium]